jgi:formate--tetrahydrofolate ligase
LREVEITINSKKNQKYKSGFDITVASELMAIFCLANSKEDLKNRIDNIIFAFSNDDKPLYVKDLGITNALLKILEQAVCPNIVQTLEENMCIVHGGPFANIAHGCNSVLATKTAMNLADYTVTEAGFGSDLGAEKFLDIVCAQNNLTPNCVVLVTSTRSLKMHGGQAKDELKVENISALKTGIENLQQHIKNLTAFNLPLVVAVTQMDISIKSEVEELDN